MSKFLLKFHDGLEADPVTWDDLLPECLTAPEAVFLRENPLTDLTLRADRPLPVIFWPARYTVHKDGRESWFSLFPGLYNPRVFCSALNGSQLEEGHYLITVRENATRQGKKTPSLGWASVSANVTLDSTNLQVVFEPWLVSAKKVNWKEEVRKYVSFTLHELVAKAVLYREQKAERAKKAVTPSPVKTTKKTDVIAEHSSAEPELEQVAPKITPEQSVPAEKPVDEPPVDEPAPVRAKNGPFATKS
jgi:hypothetical protein